MHFSPPGWSSCARAREKGSEKIVSLNLINIKEVHETKFLGIIIDNELSWLPHIDYLCKKLKCSTGVLNRIKESLPAHLYKSLYHTLFESHLSYGITVWGGVSENKLSPLFTAQKHCIRIMFGDKEAYLSKLETCVRARELDNQILGEEFYTKEHTKPLFNKHTILTLHHLHMYHSLSTTVKIIKTHTPIALHSWFTQSKRKDSLLIIPRYSNRFAYIGSSLWNQLRSALSAENGIPPEKCIKFHDDFGSLKNKIKNTILLRQKIGDQEEWCDENFKLF